MTQNEKRKHILIERRSQLLACTEAEGRDIALTSWLAIHSNYSIDECRRILSAAPREMGSSGIASTGSPAASKNSSQSDPAATDDASDILELGKQMGLRGFAAS